MSSTNEIEILLKKAVTLLHSSHSSSAAELRLLLDEEIKKRYGTEKTISNAMSKKQLEDEANFPGRAATPPPQPEEVINLTNSPAKTISDSPDTIADSDDAVTAAGVVGALLSTTADEETNLKEFGDLNCCICGEIRFTATNRLIECSKCGALYHQECHKPPISDEEAFEEQGHNWQCDNCISKPTTSNSGAKVAGSCAAGVIVTDEPMPLIATSSVASIKSKSSATSSRSSSSSNSSSPYHKLEQVQPNPIVGGKASTKHHREDRTSSSSSKISVISPSISSTSTKKHSSSSSSSSKSKSSSKHHDSKRKSNK